MEYNVVIVDDEQEAINALTLLLKSEAPDLRIVDTASDSKEGILKIYKYHPDLLFLDIHIDEKNGFDIIKEIGKNDHSPYVIFVTAFDEFALDAFKVNALDYILKPVTKEELTRVLDKFREQIITDASNEYSRQINIFSKKIRFSTQTGYFFLDPSEIIYCESDGNYTQIYTKDNQKRTVSKNLGYVQERILDNHFLRISRFHIINPDYLIEINRKQKKCIINSGDSVFSLHFNTSYLKGFLDY